MDGVGETLPGQFIREELEKGLEAAEERLKRHESCRDHMEEKGLSQTSLTDPDAKGHQEKMGTSTMRTRRRVGAAETGINVTKARMGGKKSTLAKILWKSPARTGWKRKRTR